MDIKHTDTNELASIDTADLEHVTGGGWAGDAWNWVKTNVGGLFGGGGGGGGINVGVQNGNNNRQAQGNSGSTTIGDNSPIGGQ
ncbi:MAG TPA: hypothetical protein VFV99_18360 [Kofleriaceae bacterium]|nr:hypothetical protein [Kofleriaceae bacterium]